MPIIRQITRRRAARETQYLDLQISARALERSQSDYSTPSAVSPFDIRQRGSRSRSSRTNSHRPARVVPNERRGGRSYFVVVRRVSPIITFDKLCVHLKAVKS